MNKKVLFLLFAALSCNAKINFSQQVKNGLKKINQKFSKQTLLLAGGGIGAVALIGLTRWLCGFKKRPAAAANFRAPSKCTLCPNVDADLQFHASLTPAILSILRGEDSFCFYIKPKGLSNADFDSASDNAKNAIRNFVKTSQDPLFSNLNKGQSAIFKQRVEVLIKNKLAEEIDFRNVEIEFCSVE